MGNILVFGASGFLGSALVNELGKHSDVYAVVRPESDTWRIEENSRIQIIRQHESLWVDQIVLHKPEVIICAQWKGTNRELRNDSALQHENLNHIFEIAQRAVGLKVHDFIVFGSQAETHMSKNTIIEDELDSPSCIYGEVKVKLYEKLNGLFSKTDTRFVWERVFSVFGPKEIGNSLLPSLIKNSANQKNLHLDNPDLKWSYLYIDDFISATMTILKSRHLQGIVNVGNPNLYTIEEICAFVPASRYSREPEFSWNGAGFFPEVKKLSENGWKIQSDMAKAIQESTLHIRKALNL